MMCLLWINAQRMTGCINDLYNTSQQPSLISVFFLEYTATRAQEWTLFSVPLHGLSSFQVPFWLQAALLRIGEKQMFVRPEAVLLVSQFSASPWKLHSPRVTHSHTAWWSQRKLTEGSGVREMVVGLRHKLWLLVYALFQSKPANIAWANFRNCITYFHFFFEAVIYGSNIKLKIGSVMVILGVILIKIHMFFWYKCLQFIALLVRLTVWLYRVVSTILGQIEIPRQQLDGWNSCSPQD